MPRLNRRDLIASLGASATLLASRADAACDVWRDEVAGVRTKSYECTLGEGQRLSSTFMRLSDVMFDSAGYAPLPGTMGEYQDLVRGHRLMQTPALAAFTRLFEKHAFAFEPQNMSVEYDLRGADLAGSVSQPLFDANARWRSLGVWDDLSEGAMLPMFPLPDELRRAMRNTGFGTGRQFLRYANRADLHELSDKIVDYTALWDAHPEASFSEPNATWRPFGNLFMLADIDAGSVQGFVPILTEPFAFQGCSGEWAGGPMYVPPALYVDVAVFRNDGTRPIEIDDIYGAIDTTESLRQYDSRTPPQETGFNWGPMRLAPGEGLLIVQRLLFGASPFRVGDGDEKMKPNRAVFGQTHLPKGVVVGGRRVDFEGRSHNAIILASLANCCSCPYLESWCPRAREWIEHGKVLQTCEGPDKAGSETRKFPDVRKRFRLSEREHEETTLTGASLTLTLEDGTSHILTHTDAAWSLSVGESRELVFDIPADIAAKAIKSALTVSGHYEKFTRARFEARAAALMV